MISSLLNNLWLTLLLCPIKSIYVHMLTFIVIIFLALTINLLFSTIKLLNWHYVCFLKRSPRVITFGLIFQQYLLPLLKIRKIGTCYAASKYFVAC